MELTEEELELIHEALERKLWSLRHVGMASDHARYTAFSRVREKIVAERKARREVTE